MRAPGCTKGGNVAVTITAAVFLTVICVGSTVTPMREQHVGKTLSGEQGLLAVARAIESDDQSVADQLVVADAFDGDQFLQPRHGAEVAGRGRQDGEPGRTDSIS